jgi:ankyrin repeat protein
MKICAYCSRILDDHAFECPACHKSQFAPVPHSTEQSPTGALMYASQEGQENVVIELLDKGADVNAKESDGATALMWASGKGHADVVKQLLLRGADFNARTDKGWTALMLASQEGHLPVVRALLAKGAPVNGSPNEPWPPLTLASQEGQVDVVSELLDKGADVNAKASNGATALMLAASKNHLDLCKVLLDKGANVNLKAENDVTALMFASGRGHLDIVLTLLAKGADIYAKTVDGRTAADLAKEVGYGEVANILRKRAVREDRRAEAEQRVEPESQSGKTRTLKRWWQFWKSDSGQIRRGKQGMTDSRTPKIFVCGYSVTPGSKLHRQAVEQLRVGEKLETDVNIILPEAEVISRLVNEWATLGHGVITDEQRQAMHHREKEIGQIIDDLGGIDLMRAFAYKLINDGLSYESDFFTWHGIGDWQN